MKLSREGSKKKHGDSTIFEGVGSICWIEDSKTVRYTFRNISDASSKSMSDYELELSLEDVANIIKTVSSDGIEGSPKSVASSMKNSTAPLLRLLMTSAGLLTDPKTLIAAIKPERD